MTQEADNGVPTTGVPNVYCRVCSSPLVQASEWEQQSETCWHVRLWCPECDHEQPVTLDRPHLLYLSLAIEDGFAWMMEALAEFDAVLSQSTSVDLARRAQTDRIPTPRR